MSLTSVLLTPLLLILTRIFPGKVRKPIQFVVVADSLRLDTITQLNFEFHHKQNQLCTPCQADKLIRVTQLY